jgi:hypothetical protein
MYNSPANRDTVVARSQHERDDVVDPVSEHTASNLKMKRGKGAGSRDKVCVVGVIYLRDERPVFQRVAQRDPVEVEGMDRVLQLWVWEGTFKILPAKCYRIANFFIVIQPKQQTNTNL